MTSADGRRQVVIVGGGHNALVAAAYLAAAGRTVTVLEARAEVGGAVASAQVFDGVDAQLSRFSYLVSLLPDQIVADLGLRLELRSRSIAWYAPVGDAGMLVERPESERTRRSFAELPNGEQEHRAWQAFEHDLQSFAAAVAPTLTEALPTASELQARVGEPLWAGLVERPIGELIEARFADDTVRGAVLTDALIGTFAGARDPSLRQNRCFAYHVIGNGTGEWKVPVGGMGALAGELVRTAVAAGASIRTRSVVTAIQPEPGGGATVALSDGERLRAPTVLVNCAPAVLRRLLGQASESPSGSQLKVNLLLRRLPRLRAGLDPVAAFAGTLHLGQGYARLQEAYEEAAAGRIPDPLPSEVYCHTLTDDSILSLELAASGHHTLTLFGLHTPAALFRDDPVRRRGEAGRAALAALQSVLAEPVEDCLARDAAGRRCVEVVSPVDLETELGMPGGHIFHGDLTWPWLSDGAVTSSSAERWG